MRAEPVIERLAKHSRINFLTNCVEWLGCKNEDGYGQINVNGKSLKAHRVAYEEHLGRIPEDLKVCHQCDNPSCINPQHLFLGTQKDNMQDCAKKGRIVALSGAASPHSKLSVDDIMKIRADTRLNSVIAEEFGVSKTQVSGIKNGTRGLHVPPSVTYTKIRTRSGNGWRTVVKGVQ